MTKIKMVNNVLVIAETATKAELARFLRIVRGDNINTKEIAKMKKKDILNTFFCDSGLPRDVILCRGNHGVYAQMGFTRWLIAK